MSGKSYLLLQIARALRLEETYYITDTLNDEVLGKIPEMENCNIILENGVLEENQIKGIFDKAAKIEKRHVRIFIAIDSDNHEVLEYYKNSQGDDGRIVLKKLSNKFENNEIKDFNEKIAALRLVDYDRKNTILDYLFIVEKNLLTVSHEKILPPVNFLDMGNRAEIKAIIMMTVENTIPLSLAVSTGLVETLYRLTGDYKLTIQKDYLTDIENEWDSSSVKFINNSPYWTIKCLSEFAGDKLNHKVIAEAYYSLIEDMQKKYHGDIRKFNSRIKKYIMLDTIQIMFSDKDKGGTLQLPFVIYERLHTIMYDNYHFLHQEAKCELRVARRKKDESEREECLGKANLNIKRALDSALKSNAKKIDYTINHMMVTEALILSNYLLACKNKDKDKINEAIDVYYEAFVVGANLVGDDFLLKDDLDDIKEFLNYIITNTETSQELSDGCKSKFGEIYEKRYGMHVRL
jgi:hypothetical protein